MEELFWFYSFSPGGNLPVPLTSLQRFLLDHVLPKYDIIRRYVRVPNLPFSQIETGEDKKESAERKI